MRIILKKEDIVIRKMEDKDSDYRLIAKWLTNKNLLQFAYGRTNPQYYSKVKARFQPKIYGRQNITPCIFSFQNKEIGYIQYYPVAKAKDYQLDDHLNVWAIDMWIGEEDYWSKGVGSKVLALLSDQLLNKVATKAVIDPHVDNPRAIRAYEKAGFKKVKILKMHEWHEGRKVDSWLLEKSK